MSAGTARDETLAQLRKTRKAMLSAEWKLSLEDADAATQSRAARDLLRVEHGIQNLENAVLAEIAAALVANERDLETGRKAVARALTKLDDTKAVLTALSGFLSIVGRIVTLVA